MKEKLNAAYDKHYRLMLILPAILLVISLFYISHLYFTTGDIMRKDVSLTGGTTITVYDGKVDVEDLEKSMSSKLVDISVTKLSDISTGNTIGFVLATQSEENLTQISLENYLGYKLNSTNSGVEFSGSTLSSGFYQQLLQSMILAFIFMSLVVYLVFGTSKHTKAFAAILTAVAAKLTFPSVAVISVTAAICAICAVVAAFYYSKNKKEYILCGILAIFAIITFIFPNYYFMILALPTLIIIYLVYSIPSMAVITCAFADIVMTLFVVDLIGMKVSTAGIVAFLMLIGYSVDTDILLTTRVLKMTSGTVNARILGAFKTGVTMSLASFIAVLVGYIIARNFSDVLSQIFLILCIGLLLDIFNTWVTNASLIKWYVEHKKGADTK